MFGRAAQAHAHREVVDLTKGDVGVARGVVEAVAGAAAGRGGDGEVAVLVDVGHFCGLGEPVVGVVLDDAEGVDPDVVHAECPGEGDGVLEGLGDLLPWDVLKVRFEILLQGAQRLAVAPAVAETGISPCAGMIRLGALGDEEDAVVVIADADDSGGEIRVAVGQRTGLLVKVCT